MLGFVVIGAYAVLCVRAGDRVPGGAQVAGVAIGGLHADAAEAKLRRELGARSQQPIVVTGGGQTDRIDAAEAGLRFDAARSVRDAGGGSSYWPSRLWRYYTGGGDERDAAARVDRRRFDLAAAQVVQVVGKPVVQGEITFRRGRPVVRRAETGRHVTRAAARTALRRGFLSDRSAHVAWSRVEPKVTDHDVTTALSRFVTPATSAPVTLVLDGHRVTAPPALFTKAVQMRSSDGRLEPHLDVDRLMTALEPVMSGIAGTPQPARIVIDDGRPRVVPSRIGITFDRAVLRAKFLQAATRPDGQRTLRVKGVSAAPSFTTADARRMKVTRRVAAASTPFGYAEFRNTNIARGAALVNGWIVQPGRTFSLATALGKVTEKRGFVDGFENDGGTFRPATGAGLSQVASTLYAAAFDAGMKDAGHVSPRAATGRYPRGREVRFAPGSADLRFTNDTPYGVLVVASSSPASAAGEGRLSVELWSSKTWDVQVLTGKKVAPRPFKVRHRRGATCSAQTGHAGYTVAITRVFRKPGQRAVDHRQRTLTRYPPTPAVVCDP